MHPRLLGGEQALSEGVAVTESFMLDPQHFLAKGSSLRRTERPKVFWFVVPFVRGFQSGRINQFFNVFVNRWKHALDVQRFWRDFPAHRFSSAAHLRRFSAISARKSPSLLGRFFQNIISKKWF